ncbi:hypothetical protein ABZ413_29660 [Nocardia rhamnosiphila]|uniref:hypothetical protein n=1 Tax=Nocardia rhamnosiphila TaxID=426716 RepID=UPI0033FC17EF
MNISPCRHPQCDRDAGEAQLTSLGVCEPCQDRVAVLLDRLAADYVSLKTDNPIPIRRQSGVRTKSDPRSGSHPAEWSSVQTSAIAALFNTAHRILAHEIGAGVVPSSTASENARVRAGHRFLKHRVPELCKLDTVGDFITAADNTHRGIRARLGLNKRRRERAAAPCPSCQQRTLFRYLDPDFEQISCDTCGYTVDPSSYGLLVRMICDTLLPETPKIA